MVLQKQTPFAVSLVFLLSGELLSHFYLNYLRLNLVFCTYSSPFHNRKKLALSPQNRISEE